MLCSVIQTGREKVKQHVLVSSVQAMQASKLRFDRAIPTGFLEEATEIPRVRRGTMLTRDSELRRLWWAVVGKDPALGDRGPEIAAAMAGPGDMVRT